MSTQRTNPDPPSTTSSQALIPGQPGRGAVASGVDLHLGPRRDRQARGVVPANESNLRTAPVSEDRPKPAPGARANEGRSGRPRLNRHKRRICHLERGDHFRTLATDREGIVTGFPHRGGPMVQLEGLPWPIEVHPELIVQVTERAA